VTIRFKPILIKRKLSAKSMTRALEASVLHIVNLMGTDFDKTHKTWKRKPKFVKSGPKRSRGRLIGHVGTDNKIYGFVSKGTRKDYPIFPRRPGGVLAFPGGKYKAKTRPRVIGSRAGGARGPTRFAKHVLKHPGIKARDFDKEIAKRRQKNFVTIVKKNLMQAIRRR
jgi:hypothetical protein